MMNKNKKITLSLIILITIAFVFRIILSFLFREFHSDIGLFFDWAECLYEFGPQKLYTNTSCDYPPGYMYVLWALGWIIEWLKGIGADYSLTVLILKIPSMITDILTSLLIYKIAAKKQTQGKAVFLMAIYLFNPAVILNSSVWGQVDSILSLMVLLTIYLVYRNKMCLSYFSFCIGFILKPQIIFIAPIVLLGIINNVFINNFSVKKLLKNLVCGLGSVLISILLCLPYNLHTVIMQYKDTITSFPFATFNAYNFWALFGLNEKSQETEWLFGAPVYIWGYFFIAVICLLILYIWVYVFKRKNERNKSYFYLAALLIVGVFAFLVRMHERYMFPVMALLLAYCAVDYYGKNILLYVIASVIHYINVVTIYRYYCYAVVIDVRIERFCGMATVGLFIYMLYKAFKLYIKADKKSKKQSFFKY